MYEQNPSSHQGCSASHDPIGGHDETGSCVKWSLTGGWQQQKIETVNPKSGTVAY